FSSRRRHTSFSRDWSSDVCSSDLVLALARERRSEVMVLRALGLPPAGQARTRTAELLGVGALGTVLGVLAGWAAAALLVPTLAQIGRASCRERVLGPVARGSAREH